jgi:hypothetical protein
MPFKRARDTLGDEISPWVIQPYIGWIMNQKKDILAIIADIEANIKAIRKICLSNTIDQSQRFLCELAISDLENANSILNNV